MASIMSVYSAAQTSIDAALATNPSAFAAFTSIAGLNYRGDRHSLYSTIDSIVDGLPSEVAVPYRIYLSAELSLKSSIVNGGAKATGTGGGATGTTGGGSATAGSQSQNAAPTAGLSNAVSAAGVVVGAFAAAVALL
jgi:hypothetical protein